MAMTARKKRMSGRAFMEENGKPSRHGRQRWLAKPRPPVLPVASFLPRRLLLVPTLTYIATTAIWRKRWLSVWNERLRGSGVAAVAQFAKHFRRPKRAAASRILIIAAAIDPKCDPIARAAAELSRLLLLLLRFLRLLLPG